MDTPEKNFLSERTVVHPRLTRARPGFDHFSNSYRRSARQVRSADGYT